MAKLAGAAVIFAVVVAGGAGCGGRASSGPAWPKSAGRVEVTDPAKDGGESLEPEIDMHVAAIERAEDRSPAVEPIVVEGSAPAAADPAASAGTGKPDEAKAPVGEIEIEVIEIKPEDLELEPEP